MAMHQINPQGAKLSALDPIWDRVRSEAEDIVRREPELASFIYSTCCIMNVWKTPWCIASPSVSIIRRCRAI